MNQRRQELEGKLVARAQTDGAFRQALISDPQETLAQFLGMTLPPNTTITVLEEQPGQHYLVLPPATPALEAVPLDELELALVGGGRTLRPGNSDPPGDPSGRQWGGDARPNRRTSC